VQPQSGGDVTKTEESFQTTHESVADNIEATEPTLQQSSSVSVPTPVQPEASVQEPIQKAIATDSTTTPSTPAQLLENPEITPSTDEDTTPQAAIIQPISESTTIQRQVTEVTTIETPREPDVLQAATDIEVATDETDALSQKDKESTPTTDWQTAPEISREQQPNLESSLPPEARVETTVQRQGEENAIASDFAPSAIAPATNSLPDSPPISPSKTQESSPGIASTLPTDNISSTEPGLIQPFQQPGTPNVVAQPELPTVLQNLTVLNPLGSTPLIQTAAIEDTTPPSEPQPVIVERRELPAPVFSSSSISAQSVSQTTSTSSNREAVASVPDEWSSIAELLNRSSSPASHSSSPVSSQFSDLQPFGTTETPIQAQFEPVMRQISASPAPTAHTDEKPNQVTEVKANTEDVAAPSPEQLEKLAREIYGLVRQRLQIEQERSGNSYLGRLPW
jgi:hypothetical protein